MLIRRTIGPSTTHRGTVTEVIGPEAHSWGNDPDNVNTTVFGGPTPHVLRKLSPETQTWGVDANNVNTTVFPPSGGGDLDQAPAGSPTCRQLLGLDAISPFHTRATIKVLNSGSTTTQLTPVVWRAGTMLDYQTIDGRKLTVWWHSNNQDAFQVGTKEPDHCDSPGATCPINPALVGSHSGTPKAEVGRYWGLDHATGGHSPVPQWNVNSYPVGPYPNTWQQWKSLNAYANQNVDGQTDPFDQPGRSYIDCKPGAWTSRANWCRIDGYWCRDMMDGFSSMGSPIEFCNNFVQRNHDDIHWMGNSLANATGPNNFTAPVHSFRNFYWNIYQGFSYKESAVPPAAGGEFSIYEETVSAHTRFLPYENSSAAGGSGYPQDNYDAHAHSGYMAWRGGVNRPKLKFINSVILMLGQPAQLGLPQICVPLGSQAQNSHFIYYDMNNDSGDHPPHPGEPMQQNGTGQSMSIYSMPGMSVHVVSGTDMNRGICTTPGHGDHPVQDHFWPAVNTWISQHPQFGLRQMTGDWTTDYNYLNSYS